jgi:glyoxylate reductase
MNPPRSAAQVLIAAELEALLDPDPVPGQAVSWIAADAPTPAGDCVAIVPLLSRRMGEEEFRQLPRLAIVANCATGVDNVDLTAARRRGIIVTNTPDVLTDATADLTWALILAVARRLKEGLGLITDGRWTGWHPTQLLGMELTGRTLGIVGAGRIGQAVARRGQAFGMRIIYTARSPKLELERATGATRASLSRVLSDSDIVSLHVPATPETRELMNRDRFAEMKPGAILINTSRGEVVSEPALLRALDEGRLWGAGLDVFAREPSVPAALVAHPRVVTLPHLGSATRETRRAMAALAVRNVREVLAGRDPVTPVSGFR